MNFVLRSMSDAHTEGGILATGLRWAGAVLASLALLAVAEGFIASSVAQAETLVLVAGGSETAEPVAATKAKLTQPFAVDFDRAGNLWFVEMTGERLRVVDPQGMLSTAGGNGAKGNGGDGGPLAQAQFHGSHSLAVGPDGALYVADTWNNRIRRVDPAKRTIAPFAGTGVKGSAGDGGPAAEAQFGGVYCIAFTPDGKRLLVADLDNRKIRSIDLGSGRVTTVAGNGKKGVPAEDDTAINAPLVDPRAVAADAQGNFYILERSGNALRRVDAAGTIRTVIGGPGSSCRDEAGQAPAPLNGPKHLCVDAAGNILIADTESHLVRKYLPQEDKLVRVAGTGKAGTAGLGGPPRDAQLNKPHGVYVHPSGEIFIADSSNDRIVKIVP